MVITLSHHSQDVGCSPSADKAREKLIEPKAAVRAKSIEIALQALFAQTTINFQEEGFRIGNQGAPPAPSTTVFIKDLIVMDVWFLGCGPKGAAGIATNLVSALNALLSDGTR